MRGDGGGSGENKVPDDIAAFRAAGIKIEGYEEREPEPKQDGHFPVLRENWPAMCLFLACETQWQRAGMTGIVTGLDYPGVEASARLAGIEMTPDLFGRLQVMERAALSEMAKARR